MKIFFKSKWRALRCRLGYHYWRPVDMPFEIKQMIKYFEHCGPDAPLYTKSKTRCAHCAAQGFYLPGNSRPTVSTATKKELERIDEWR